MKNIQQLLTDLQTGQVNESFAFEEIQQQLAQGKIKDHDLIECIHTLNNQHKISDEIYQQVFNLIQRSTAETVVENSAKTQVISTEKTQVISPEKTQVTSVNENATSDSAKTQIVHPTSTPSVSPDDKTVVSTVNKAQNTGTEKTVATSSNSDQTSADAKTVVSPQHRTQQDAQATTSDETWANTSLDNEKTIADSETIIAQPEKTSADAATVLGQQTRREQTRQKSPNDSQKQKKLETGGIIKDRFILKNIIGSGGMSVVFRALDLRKQEAKNQNPYVAIKILGDTFKHHPLSLLALERETQKIQSLAHPNIITVYDFDRDGENIYMTMECLEGESLDQVIRNNKIGMSFQDAQSIIEGMCQALIYAHSKNIIHSDFKPENVYFTKNKVTKVLDFGIARAKKLPDNKAVDTVFDAGSLSALTPPYASLEMLKNEDPDPRDDIYALGCVVYKLLTGEHPYKGLQADNAQKAELTPPRINKLNRKQWQTLSAALAFERKDRTETVEEFLDGIIPKSRGWVYALTVGIVLAIGTSGYLGTSITEQAAPKVKLTEEQKEKVQLFLETADLYFSLGYLATPPGDSALDQYERVLEIDPTSKPAIEGKKRLVERYQQLAEEKQQLGQLEESEQLLETALLIEPDHEELLAELKKIKNLRAENR